jgi:hypothetical protein
MSNRGAPVGKERDATSQPTQRDARHQKLARFIGVVAGNTRNLDFESQFGSSLGASFDWDPWIRYMMPEFAIIMTADRRTQVRWPTGIILTDSGRVVTIDKGNCHPSDASALLSGETMSEIATLLDSLESAIHGMVEGDRVASALQFVKNLRRVCRFGQ